LQQSVLQAVNPAVDRQFLSIAPRLLNNRRGADVLHLLDNIQFAQQIESAVVTVDVAEFLVVLWSRQKGPSLSALH
jgi:hypothetical protein